MEVITYSLRDDQGKSDQYYRAVANFTDEVLAEAERRLAKPVAEFQSYLKTTGREAPRTFAEYALELLNLGVLWRVYAGQALSLPRIAREILFRLVGLRQRRPDLQQRVDFLRGILMTLFQPPGHRYEPPRPTLANLDRLLLWLEATGNFDELARRISRWRSYLSGWTAPLEEAIKFADWFEDRSLAVLGCYTSQVGHFLANRFPDYRWRYDMIFCGRQRVEYHLNMVGTEVLNRAYRKTFLETSRRLVLAPPCMAAQPEGKCQAQATLFGASCAGCTPACRIHQLTQLGKKHGFEVRILPDDFSVYRSQPAGAESSDRIGVVGISCVLTNTSGGWQTRRLGLPAQGLPLDYCGCSYHWHPQGFPTDVNFQQLLRSLEKP